MTPAVILLQAEPGQSTTQSLTVENRTSGQFSFEMEALDVVVRDGKRTFVRAGEIPEGIARSAVFSPKLVILQPGDSATVHVTVTVPPNPAVRAIVALFRAQTVIVGSNGVGMTGSLGALLTFTLSKKFHMENSVPGAVNVSSAKTFSLSQSLVNTGTEPVVPKGVLAIVSSSGLLIGKMPLTTQRLLPGEQMEFRTEYARPLKPGKYRALTSIKYEGGVLNSSGDFVVP